MVEKTKDGIEAIKTVVESVQKSKTTKAVVANTQIAVDYIEEQATQAVDYVLGRTDELESSEKPNVQENKTSPTTRKKGIKKSIPQQASAQNAKNTVRKKSRPRKTFS